MGFEIGRAFSDAVLGSLERERDRRAANPARKKRTSTVDTGLAEAMLRQEGEDRRNLRDIGLRRELAGQEAGLSRDKLGQQRELELLDLGRRGDADRMAQESRQGALDIRGYEAENRAGRYAARGDYENRMAGVREQ